MKKSDAHVLACWGAHLDEFPVDSLYLIEEFRTLGARIKSKIRRELDRSTFTWAHLTDHAISQLINHLERHPVDVIYTFFGWHAAQLIDVLNGLKTPMPLAFTIGGSDIIVAHLFGPDYVQRLQEACSRAEIILCTSEFLRGRLLDFGAPAEKVRVLHCGVDIGAAPLHEPSIGATYKILAVSRLTALKGIPHTLRAFVRTREVVPDAHLEIIGDGEERDAIQLLVAELGLDASVTLSGSQPLGYVYAAMANADLFVQHSIETVRGQQEGLGVSLLEASAHGLPIVSTRCGGIPEGVVDHETGILVEPGDEDAMAQAMIDLARDPARRREMGIAGRAHVEQRYNIETLNQELESILLDICGRG